MSSKQKSDLAAKLVNLSSDKRKLFVALAKKQAQKNNNDNIPNLADISTGKLSFSQEQALTAQLQDTGVSSQNLKHLLQIKGELNIPQLDSAFRQIVARHQILRTGYQAHKDGFKVLELDPQFWLPEHQSLTNITELHSQVTHWFETPFVLDNEFPIRVKLFSVDSNHLIVAINIHHIAADGRSIAILLQDFSAFYQNKGVHELPVLNLQYQDIADWTRNQTRENDELQYWRDNLKDVSSLNSFYTDKLRPKVLPSAGLIKSIKLSTELTILVKLLSEKLGISHYSLLLSVFSLFVQLRSTEKDVVIGSPVSTRQHPATQNLIGYFVNVLPLRFKLEAGHSFNSWTKYCQSQLTEAMSHSQTPMTKIVSDLHLVRSTDHAPLVQIMFSFLEEDFQLPTLKGLELSLLPSDAHATDMEFALNVVKQADSLTCHFEYNTALFSDELIAQMTQQWLTFLANCMQNPSLSLADIVTKSNKIQFPKCWPQKTQRAEGMHFIKLLPELIKKYADKPICDGKFTKFTYQQAWQQANSLAACLQAQGIKLGDSVGLHSSNKPEIIPCVWGIWLAGAVLVPLNINNPLAYKQQVSIEAKLKLIIGNEELSSQSTSIPFKEFGDLLYTQTEYKPLELPPYSTAAIYFTSGSTGKAKGVACQHEGYFAAISDLADIVGVTENDKVLQFSSISFDVLIEELMMVWLHGGCSTWALDDNNVSITELTRVIDEYQVTLIEAPTVLWHQWVEAVNRGIVQIPVSLRTILVGGEPVDTNLCKRWPHEQCRVLNVYGSTETCITNIVGELSLTEFLEHAPIGFPMQCCQVYVLDEAKLPVPVGQKGELYLVGEAIGKGYINADEQHKIRFVPDPIKQDSSVVFRTGDIVSYDTSGNLFCYGRKAFQVKLNGFSIEPGHIESVLRAIEQVSNAAVVLIEEDQQHRFLVAFVEASENYKPDIIEAISNILPHYMLPQHYCFCDKMPINHNGKIDRKKLKAAWLLELINDQSEAQTIPDDDEANKLLKIWKECLGSNIIVNPNSNFFAMGGSSIDMIKLSMLMQESFEIEASVALLMEKQGFMQQYRWLQKGQKSLKRELQKADLSANLPLSDEQRGIWIAQQLRGDQQLYRIVANFEIQGQINKLALSDAFQHVIDINPIYRLEIQEKDGDVTQRIKEQGPQIRFIDVADETSAKQWIKDFQQYNVTDEMLEVLLLSVSDTKHYMMFNIHHIVTDEWSMNLLNKQLLEYYEAALNGTLANTSVEGYHYLDYVVNQVNQQENSASYKDSLNSWKTALSEIKEISRLPADRLLKDKNDFSGSSELRHIDGALFDNLKSFALDNNMTLNTLMQAIFSYVLRVYWREPQVNYAYSTSSREAADWQKVQGYFVQTHWSQLSITYDMNFADICEQAKKNFSRLTQTHGFPVNHAIAALPAQHVLNELMEIPVMFNYQREEDILSELLKADLKVSYKRPEKNIAKFDLTVNLIEKPLGLDIYLDYRSALYSPELISHFADTFELLAERLISQSQVPLCDIPLVDEKTWHKLVVEDNHTAEDSPDALSLVQMFEHCVTLDPQASAVLEITPATIHFPESAQVVSYQQLNQQANQSARYLQQNGVNIGDVVVIALAPNAELVTQVLAAHKLGAIVVTVDHNMPKERLMHILQQAKPKIIVKSENVQVQRDVEGQQYTENSLLINELVSARRFLESDNLNTKVSKRSAAYLVFTSGSTGKPKAIVNHNAGLVNIVDYQSELFNITPGDNVLQYASVNFEGTIADIYMPLIRNACCCLLSEGERTDMDYINQLIQSHEISIVTMTPSAIPALTVPTLRTIKSLLAAGEALPVKTANYAIAQTNLFNLYGPSECSLCTTIESYHEPVEKIQLGTRVRKMSFYLVNEELMLLPRGVIGEICISGIGVTHGYHENRQLTDSKFVSNPFALLEQDKVLYRSGDMARACGNGMLQFIGRDDEQIKIRGQRVELKEIETVMRQNDSVSDAFVLVKENGDLGDYLLGFFSQQQDSIVEQSALIVRLKQHLPDYMVPARLICVDVVPYTPNGKLDKEALFALDEAQRTRLTPTVALDEMEQKVWQTWTRILGDKQILPNPAVNFFELGGNSLHLTKMVAELNQEFGLDVSISEFLKNLTLAQQATWLSELTEGKDIEELEW